METRRYELSVKGNKDCAKAMKNALKCLEGRWKMMILSHLFSSDTMRFSELSRAIDEVSPKMLIQQLRELESDSIVIRTVYPEIPPRVEYTLTSLGRKLRPVFIALLDWAEFKESGPEVNKDVLPVDNCVLRK